MVICFVFLRMIRQSEGTTSTAEERGEKPHSHKDGALWAPTGWVHVEKDIDFSDPKVVSCLYSVFKINN